jgi:glutathione S-transferase
MACARGEKWLFSPRRPRGYDRIMITLYSGPLSLFTAKVRVALAEKGLPYELVGVPFSRRDGYTPKHPEVLARHPKAQVPVLVDGDLTVWDSTVILEYLEDRYPTPPLYPADVAGRARCRQIEHHADDVLFPHVLTLITDVFYKPAGGGDAARIAAAHDGITARHRWLDAELAGREFFCGRFTVADAGTFLTILFAASLGVPPDPSLAHLAGWMARTGARPSIAAEVAGMTAASQAA